VPVGLSSAHLRFRHRKKSTSSTIKANYGKPAAVRLNDPKKAASKRRFGLRSVLQFPSQIGSRLLLFFLSQAAPRRPRQAQDGAEFRVRNPGSFSKKPSRAAR